MSNKGVGRKCSICTHDESEKINSLILRGDSFRGISLKFGISDMSVARHAENCLKADVRALIEQKKIKQAIDVYEELREQLQFTKQLREAALKHLTESGEIIIDVKMGEFALKAVNTCDAVLDKFAKIEGLYTKEKENPDTVNKIIPIIRACFAYLETEGSVEYKKRELIRMLLGDKGVDIDKIAAELGVIDGELIETKLLN